MRALDYYLSILMLTTVIHHRQFIKEAFGFMYFRVKTLILQYKNEHQNRNNRLRKYRRQRYQGLQRPQRELGSDSRAINTGKGSPKPAYNFH